MAAELPTFEALAFPITVHQIRRWEPPMFRSGRRPNADARWHASIARSDRVVETPLESSGGGGASHQS